MSVLLMRRNGAIEVLAGAQRLKAMLSLNGQASALLNGEQVTVARNEQGQLMVLPGAANDADAMSR